MKLILCVIIILSAIAICLDYVKVDALDRRSKCHQKTDYCVKSISTKVTDEEIMALCNEEPLSTESTKCIISCQMQLRSWTDKNGVFIKNNYVNDITITELTRRYYNEVLQYKQAAEKVADKCKKTKAENRCETAYLLFKCLEDEGNKLKKLHLGYRLFDISYLME